MSESVDKCETRQCKAVFPGTLNANDTLFGGLLMQWMDEVAFLTATRHTRQKMFTITVENLKFRKPIRPNSLVELIGYVEKAGPVRLKVKVDTYVEELYGMERELAVEGVFYFSAVDENGHPIRLKNPGTKTV